ncbi:MAG: Uncharacterized protein G01um10145_952 [Microgenomates group bacterium Gr01-1014_5]|nr:MAG: Uncharacterized protein G01um10145_952 [Microgenomates group bacterium Gr01-1014_5]
MKQKLYCYVDESGQDTKGDIFIVSVVVTGRERDELLKFCEGFEQKSGKQKDKWGRSKPKRRLDYIKLVFSNKKLRGKLRYSVYKNLVDYDMATIVGIAKAVHFKEPSQGYTTLVYVDGLSKTKRQEYGSELRKLGVPTRKVQGVARDENNSLTRPADALAGFVHDVFEGKSKDPSEMKGVFEKGVKNGNLVEV